MRRYIFLGMMIVVGAGGLGYWRYFAGSQEPTIKFETAPVERGNLTAKVTTTGTLSALVTVQVGSQVSGRIQKIFVDFNSQVKQGQLIAKIDPRMFESAVEQARANALSAQSNLDKAKAQAADAGRQLERTKSLAEKSLVSQADLDSSQANADSAKASVEAAKAAVEQARANLNQAKINLDYTDILSPINGVVISRSIDVGQTVAASLQAPVLFTIAEDLKKMQVDTNVAESDVGKLAPEMAAYFTVDAFPTERFKGKIRQIRNAAQTVQNVVTYDAVIDVDNPELKLKPGMTANVNVVFAERADAIKVPNSALRFKPTPAMLGASGENAGKQGNRSRVKDGQKRGEESLTGAPDAMAPDKRIVWLLKEQKPERVHVRIGVTDGSKTEIIDGKLNEGDLVITDASDPDSPNANAKPKNPGGHGPGGGGGMRRLF